MNAAQNNSGNSFGEQLTNLRLSRELSRAKVAQAANISTAYYSSIESNSRLPPPHETLMRIVAAIECNSTEMDNLTKLAAEERGRSGLDVHLPEEVQLLISELRAYGLTLEPRVTKAMAAYLHEVISK